MEQEFRYRQSARRPSIWIAAALHLPLFGLAWQVNAPLWLLGIWAISAAMVTWRLLAHRTRGLRLTRKALVLNAWINPKVVPLSRIALVEDLRPAPPHKVQARLKLHDGGLMDIDPRDAPNWDVLQREFESRGINVLAAA